MSNRKHSATSKAAHDSIKGIKSELYEKIIEGLKRLRVGGNFEEISKAAGITPAQCHKRLPELVEMGKVYNCGYTRPTSSGRSSMVRQLVGLGYKHKDKTPVKAKKESKPVSLNPIFE